MAEDTRDAFPVVLRFEGLHPEDLGGYEAHRLRKGGDLGHVDRTRSQLNRRLIGEADWAEQALAEIAEMRAENFAEELEALERRKRRKDLRRRLAEGPKDPWRASRHGPLREVILTANREWFEGDLSEFLGESDRNPREVAFEERAVAWLKQHFDDDVIHARADLDEQAYHIHAVIMPRATVEIKGATRRMLQPSIHPMIKDYEAAQDSVGAWFAEIGLTRGERRAQAIRNALASGQEPPKQPRHVRPAEWRRQEELRLARKAAEVEERRRKVAAREDEAQAVIDYADAVAAGRMNEDGREVAPEPVKDAPPAPPVFPPDRKASGGFQRARKAFRMALRRLTARAEADARRRAEAEFAEALDSVHQAREAIAKAAQTLPQEMRARIAQALKIAAARTMRAERSAPGRDGRDPGRNLSGERGRR
ncbi:hypothetical protein EV663_1297 [Rhodovulum bhavnagarense]|uniref:Plasmid recombination enzyme n=1 Tax=Rhodovulum bhavnagarense TaxID=992286 RepID=A0A4V2SVF9_9RHOB|nr:plasmid recombination protein [Rhodovulum bhavnagarense]TCP58396.1 hypothetical protein EV663_1297 [Rhodovulum bhavnagarense]